MRVYVTLNCQVKQGQFENMLPFLQANLPNVRGFKGNLRVSVRYDESNSELLLDEEWLSKADHQDYLAFIERNGVLGQLAAFLTAPPKIKYFHNIDI